MSNDFTMANSGDAPMWESGQMQTNTAFLRNISMQDQAPVTFPSLADMRTALPTPQQPNPANLTFPDITTNANTQNSTSAFSVAHNHQLCDDPIGDPSPIAYHEWPFHCGCCKKVTSCNNCNWIARECLPKDLAEILEHGVKYEFCIPCSSLAHGARWCGCQTALENVCSGCLWAALSNMLEAKAAGDRKTEGGRKCVQRECGGLVFTETGWRRCGFCGGAKKVA